MVQNYSNVHVLSLANWMPIHYVSTIGCASRVLLCHQHKHTWCFIFSIYYPNHMFNGRRKQTLSTKQDWWKENGGRAIIRMSMSDANCLALSIVKIDGKQSLFTSFCCMLLDLSSPLCFVVVSPLLYAHVDSIHIFCLLFQHERMYHSMYYTIIVSFVHISLSSSY